MKALAVVSHNPYIQIYKVRSSRSSCSSICSRSDAWQPILLLALDEYFKEPSIECLARLYRAINAMNTSQIPQLTFDERTVLRTSERKDIFIEKFIDASGTGTYADSPTSSKLPSRKLPSSSTLAEADDNQEVLDKSDARSVLSVDGLSIDSSSFGRSTENLASMTQRSRADTLSSNEDSTLSRYSGGLLSMMPQGSERAMTPLPTGGRPKDTHFFDTRITYAGIPLPIRVPLATFPDEIGDVSEHSGIFYSTMADSSVTLVLSHQPRSDFFSAQRHRERALSSAFAYKRSHHASHHLALQCPCHL